MTLYDAFQQSYSENDFDLLTSSDLDQRSLRISLTVLCRIMFNRSIKFIKMSVVFEQSC